MAKKITALMILDGFGISPDETANAVKAANTPNIDSLIENYPHTYMRASGEEVGLPAGQMGNSEVGHLNIGAGRIVYQELTRITKAAKEGRFEENPAFTAAMQNALKKNSSLHIMGLASNGGVHSHLTHLYAIVRMAKKYGLKKVYLHCFMDGRDVPPDSGLEYIRDIETEIASIGTGKIATVIGRYYAMDRDSRWERVVKAYDAMVHGKGKVVKSAVEAVESSYADGVTDEFIVPSVVYEGEQPTTEIKAEDSVIFYNFRPDRAREITRALTQELFTGFERTLFPLCYVCMTQYDASFENIHIAFKPESLDNTFGEYISKKGLKQLRIAETEKYAHVTFFFNGGVEKANDGEDRVLIPSPKVATYDLKPEMSAYEVAEKADELIRSGKYDVMILNFANPDMVGHTGVMSAAVKAVEAVDECVGKLTRTILECGGEVIITADHGNAEKMADEFGGAFTAHTTSLVPFILVSDKHKNAILHEGILADIAPTMLELMGIEQPCEMTGSSVITK